MKVFFRLLYSGSIQAQPADICRHELEGRERHRREREREREREDRASESLREREVPV